MSLSTLNSDERRRGREASVGLCFLYICNGCKLPVYFLEEIARVTGVSWNKRFKRQFGSITKFLRSNQNVFYFNDHTKAVTLLHIDQQRFANSHLMAWDNPLEVSGLLAVEVVNNDQFL